MRTEQRIDYIKQLNGFERWLESHYLPSAAQLLYYKLLSINNMAGWCEWIQVDNQRVMSRCQMSREATLVENRNKLIEAGLIEFQRGKKGSPNKYKICTFKSVGKTVGETVVQTEVQTVGETVAIYRYRKRQDNNTHMRESKNKFNNFNQREDDVNESELIDNGG
ncbi:MAG TPA: hypothetical protein DD432_07000 [Eubacterium sp.]|nr:hypothetical protein [Eubacterium sp.]